MIEPLKPSFIDKAYQRFNQGVVAIAVVSFIGMLLSTWGQVLFRKLEITVDWTEESARVFFLLSMFLGIAIAIRERKHIVVNFLFNKLPPRAQIFVRLFFNLIILVFLIFLFRGAALLVGVTWESYMISLDWLRTGYLYAGECVAIVLMFLYLAMDSLKDLTGLKSQSSQSEDDLN